MGLYLPSQSFLPFISAPQHSVGMPCNKTTPKQGLRASGKRSDHAEGVSLDQAEPLMASVGLGSWGMGRSCSPSLAEATPVS